MRKRKKVILFVVVPFFLLLAIGISYAWRAFPIISGYGAKNMASAIYLQHRSPEEILKEDLGEFPISVGSFTVDERDSSVTGTVWGFAKQKAIYRKGLGCTLINSFGEAEVRKQHVVLPPAPITNQDS